MGRHGDGDGLYLVVSSRGSKSWICRVQKNGKRRDIGLGSAKKVPLALARERAAKAAHHTALPYSEVPKFVTYLRPGDSVGRLALATVKGGRDPGQQGGAKAGHWGFWHGDKDRGAIRPLSLSAARFGSGWEDFPGVGIDDIGGLVLLRRVGRGGGPALVHIGTRHDYKYKRVLSANPSALFVLN